MSTEAAKQTTVSPWTPVDFETPGEGNKFAHASMALSFGGKFDSAITAAGKKLNDLIKDIEKTGIDNPAILSQISATSNTYNSGRMLQSSMIKTLKETAQHCIRNV